MSACDCSKSWEGYKPSLIEKFHGEAMENFHKGAQYKVNERMIEGIRFMNGIEFNRLLAEFKVKIMKEYGITSDAIKIEELD